MSTPPPDDHAARLARHAAAVQAETAAPVVFPRVDLNGSGARQLAEGYEMAAGAITVAMDKLGHTVPNGRDYPDEAALRVALADHRQRLALLARMRDDYWALYKHCRAATRERTG